MQRLTIIHGGDKTNHCPQHSVGVVASATFPQSAAGLRYLEHWQLDAGHGWHVADDGPDDFAFARCLDADSGESAGLALRFAGRCHGGYS